MDRHALPLVAFGVLAALVAIALVTEPSTILRSQRFESVSHLLIAAVLTAGMATALTLLWRRPPLLLVLTTGSGVTVLFELVQLVAPSRAVELSDVVAGLAGVLLSGMVIELSFGLFNSHRVTATIGIGAAVAAVALVAVLFFGAGPESDESFRPNGTNCGLTAIAAEGGRLTIGREPSPGERCIETDSGGLGRLGDIDADTRNNVLVSSHLSDFAEAVSQNGRVTVSSEFQLDGETAGFAGTVVTLSSASEGNILAITVAGDQLQVRGPARFRRNIARPELRFNGLKPGSTHVVTVEVDAGFVRVSLDGEPAGEVQITNDWLAVAEAGDLALTIGNDVTKQRPFTGVIEWVEVTSS